MDFNPATLYILLCTGIAHSTVIEVMEHSPAVIPCDLNVQYPTWTGPSGLANPLITGQITNEENIKRFMMTGLEISRALLKHDGNYTCSDDSGNSQTTELDVQYFLTWGNISTASPENTTAVFTCGCHSNPPCEIYPLAWSYQQPDPVITKYYPCVPDPARENRTLCRYVKTIGLTKETNGYLNLCEFRGKGNGFYSTVTLYNTFYFPPTYVNITANKEDKTLTLECTTDSSNPVAMLNWYKGADDTASNNSIITSSYQPIIVDAEYDGKNITQSLDINAVNIKEGEMAFCCAKQLNTGICQSILLTPFIEASAGGSSIAAWMSLIIVAVSVVII